MKRERTRRAEPARGRRGRGAHRAANPVLAAQVAQLQLRGVDLSIPALSLLEGQRRPVSDIELYALAEILGVSADELLGRTSV